RSPWTRRSAPASRRSKEALPSAERRSRRVERLPAMTSGGDRRLVPVRRVDPQHLGAEQGEVAGGDRAGEHPGEVEDPQSGQRSAGRTGEGERAARGAVGPGDERLGGDGTALLVAGPLLRGAQGRGTAPGGVDGGLELLGRVTGDGGGDLLPRGGHA